MVNTSENKYIKYKYLYTLLKSVQIGGGLNFNDPDFMNKLVTNKLNIAEFEQIRSLKYKVDDIKNNLTNIQSDILNSADRMLRNISGKINPHYLQIPYSNSSNSNFAERVDGNSVGELLWGKYGYHACGLAFNDSMMEKIMYGGMFYSIIYGATTKLNSVLSLNNKISISSENILKLWEDMKVQCPGIIKLGLFYLRSNILLEILDEKYNPCKRYVSGLNSPKDNLANFINTYIISDGVGVLACAICMWYTIKYHKYNKTGRRLSNETLRNFEDVIIKQCRELEKVVDILNRIFELYICEIKHHASILYAKKIEI